MTLIIFVIYYLNQLLMGASLPHLEGLAMKRGNLWVKLISILIIILSLLSLGAAGFQVETVMHKKSALGLMPPTYLFDDDAPSSIGRASGLFAPYEIKLLESWPEAVTAGDWNSDGLVDAVVSTSYDDAPDYDHSLFTFDQDPALGVQLADQYSAGSFPNAIASRDLNQDGLFDIAVINQTEDTLSIFYQDPGNGFETPVSYITGETPDGIAIGDFNADLLFDVAISHSSSQFISIYFQEKMGGFAPPENIAVASNGFNELQSMDVNGDMLDDLVFLRGAGFSSSQIAVFLQSADGMESPYYLTATTGGFLPHGLALGDVSGNGRNDIVVTAGGNMPSAYLNVFLQQSNGDMSGTPDVYPAYHLPETVEIGDVNHDGWNDVVVVHTGWTAVSTFLQNAGGTLDSYQTDPVPYNDSYSLYGMTLADVTNDGGLDVLLATHSSVPANSGLVVLENITNAPTTDISLPQSGSYINDSISFEISGTASEAGSSVEVSVDGGLTWQAATGDLSWTFDWSLPAEDGYYLIKSRMVSSGGICESYYSEARVILDRQAPTGSFVINQDEESTTSPEVVLTISVEDVGSGVCEMQFRNAGDAWPAEWLAYAPIADFVLNEPKGDKTVEGRFKDCAGNVSQVIQDQIGFLHNGNEVYIPLISK